ncbi:MAG TPA: outer membrane beta-barrel protein [Terriglobales bacterium]|nr:outer membrane beta-barrel protein [Terriglobales bacterium]
MRFRWLPATILLCLACAAWGQVNPPVAPNVPSPMTQVPSPYGGNFELWVGGFMQFAKATAANGQPISTTNVAGAQFGLRFHATDNNSVEFRYSFAQPVQTYGSNLSVKSRANELGFDYAWTYPAEGMVRPYFLGGVSVIHYSPVASASTPGASSQSRPAITYGAGLDFKIKSQWSIRAEYRGVVYRIPDFGLIGISKWNHMPEPVLALVYHF